MKKAKLFLISLVVLTVFAVLGISLKNYNGKTQQEESTSSVSNDTFAAIKDVHYVKTDHGVKEWELKASSGKYYKDRDQAVFNDVILKVFFKDGRPLTLVGDVGMVETKTKDVEIQNNVIGSFDTTYKFYTNSLKYDSKKRRIFTPDRIVFAGYGIEIEGVGISIDIDRERFSVLKDVSTVVKGDFSLLNTSKHSDTF